MTNLYKSLGTLIKDYRQWRQLSQETLAARIRISTRELQNWENGRHRVRIDNLHDFAEATGIPMQVCVSLNADQPIWYSLQERRASFSSIEEHYVRKEFLKYREVSGNETFAISEQISTDKHIAKIFSCCSELLGHKRTLRKDVIKAAITILPDLNQILFDSGGHYVGHNICLPLSMAAYQQLKEQGELENFLTSEKLSDIVGHQAGVFFFYSIFASTINIAHQIAMNMARFFVRIEQQDKYIFAYAISCGEDVKQARNFGMVKVRNWQAGNADSFSQLYETKLDNLMGYLGTGQFLLKKHSGGVATKKPMTTNRPKYEEQQSGITSGPEHLLQEDAGKKLAAAEVLTIVKRCEVSTIGDSSQTSSLINDKKQTQKNGASDFNKHTVTCPNQKCAQNGKPRESIIISYGSYRAKNGISHPRFLCKNCGKTFRSNAGTIFYGLRSPQDRILKAFKLLLSGMPLRRVAAILGIELRTVRHWLNFAAARSDKIDVALIEALNVSRVELDALWASVEKGTLRERAILWKTRK